MSDLSGSDLPRSASPKGTPNADDRLIDELFPAERASVAVIDGHPHTLSFLSTLRCQPIGCLGVSDIGRSGAVEDLYECFGIDLDTSSVQNSACSPSQRL